MTGKDGQRRGRLIAAALPAGVAAVVVAIIIPLVATDTFRGGNPRASSIAFGVLAVLHALLAVVALRSNRFYGTIPVWVGVFVLIMGLILLDPAFAFTAHPGLRVAVIAMFLCAFGDFAAATLVFAMAFMRARSTAGALKLFD